MEKENKIKCSLKKHEAIDAVIFCQECNKYLCYKCNNHHSELFDSHHAFNLNKNIKDIFTGLCKEKDHNKELSYFCKNHNKLCCAMCLSKIEDKSNGIHKNCDVCLLEDIWEEKMKKLSENIKLLEEININLNSSVENFKKFSENIIESKEKIKSNILEVFTKIRNEINNREDQLLLEIDNYFKSLSLDENFLKKVEKMPKKINDTLERGRIIKNEKNKDNLNSLINDCIDIENNIKDFKLLNENIKNFQINENNKNIFSIDQEEIKEIIDAIKSLGGLNNSKEFKFKFIEGPNYILDKKGLKAIKIKGGDLWNCTVIGNKEIPKNRITRWKIKLNNFNIKSNSWNILVGIGPKNITNMPNFYNSCWTFICGNSQLSLKSGTSTQYMNQIQKLNKGDIVEVIVDREKGDLSFGVNDKIFGSTGVKVPKDMELYPIVLINDEGQSVEIV